MEGSSGKVESGKEVPERRAASHAAAMYRCLSVRVRGHVRLPHHPQLASSVAGAARPIDEEGGACGGVSFIGQASSHAAPDLSSSTVDSFPPPPFPPSREHFFPPYDRTSKQRLRIPSRSPLSRKQSYPGIPTLAPPRHHGIAWRPGQPSGLRLPGSRCVSEHPGAPPPNRHDSRPPPDGPLADRTFVRPEPILNDVPFAERTNSIEELKNEQTAVEPAPASATATDTAPIDTAAAPNTAVRFASTVQEISPSKAAPMPEFTSPFGSGEDSIAEVMSDQIKELSSSLQNVDLQGRRLSRFAFEPYSLPASRASLSPSGARPPTTTTQCPDAVSHALA